MSGVSEYLGHDSSALQAILRGVLSEWGIRCSVNGASGAQFLCRWCTIIVHALFPRCTIIVQGCAQFLCRWCTIFVQGVHNYCATIIIYIRIYKNKQPKKTDLSHYVQKILH